MLLQNRLNQINAQVEAYLKEIAALQTKVTQLQGHAQEVQTAEQAAESALSQIDTAISMLHAICPEEVATFWAAVDAKKNGAVGLLPATDNTGNGSHPAPVPTGPNTDESEAVEAVVTVVDEEEVVETDTTVIDAIATEVEDPEFPKNDALDNADNGSNDHNGSGDNGNGHYLLTYADLKLVDRPTLIKLANLHNLSNYKSRKRDELATMLDGMVTSEELAKASNSKHA